MKGADCFLKKLGGDSDNDSEWFNVHGRVPNLDRQ